MKSGEGEDSSSSKWNSFRVEFVIRIISPFCPDREHPGNRSRQTTAKIVRLKDAE
jgi:hypothetical protein